jgi:hypothetical protein
MLAWLPSGAARWLIVVAGVLGLALLVGLLLARYELRVHWGEKGSFELAPAATPPSPGPVVSAP